MMLLFHTYFVSTPLTSARYVNIRKWLHTNYIVAVYSHERNVTDIAHRWWCNLLIVHFLGDLTLKQMMWVPEYVTSSSPKSQKHSSVNFWGKTCEQRFHSSERGTISRLRHWELISESFNYIFGRNSIKQTFTNFRM